MSILKSRFSFFSSYSNYRGVIGVLFFIISIPIHAQILQENIIPNTIKDTSIHTHANQSLISHISNQQYQENIGENLTETILSFSLEAQNVVYSLDEPKKFNLTITNKSNELYTLQISDEYVYNVFFDMYDEIGLPISIQDSLIEKRSAQYVSYKNIVLHPTEFFTIVVNIDDFLHITKPGVYSISALFYTDIYKNVATDEIYSSVKQYVESSPLLISIVSVSQNTYDNEIANNNFTDITQRKPLIMREYNPYDVIHGALTALKNKDWNTFFSYVDITSLYNNIISNPETFNFLSKEEQQNELVRFMKRLEQGTENSDLYPPNLFTIDETRYTDYNATVEVTSQVLRDIAQLYKYNFMLSKQASGWKIVNYTSQYLGLIRQEAGRSLGNTEDYILPIELE